MYEKGCAILRRVSVVKAGLQKKARWIAMQALSMEAVLLGFAEPTRKQTERLAADTERTLLGDTKLA